MSTEIRSLDLKGLHSFLEEYPSVKPMVLYTGNEVLVKEGMPVIPVDLFLKNLVPGNMVVEYA